MTSDTTNYQDPHVESALKLAQSMGMDLEAEITLPMPLKTMIELYEILIAKTDEGPTRNLYELTLQHGLKEIPPEAEGDPSAPFEMLLNIFEVLTPNIQPGGKKILHEETIRVLREKMAKMAATPAPVAP